MGSKKLNRVAFAKRSLVVALGICFSASVYAQSADGSVFGRAKSGAKVQLVGVETGINRMVESSADGSFSFTKLPVGRYLVTAEGKSYEVDVLIGSGTEVRFDNVTTVTVSASRKRNPIDVSSVESGSVFSIAEINALPVSRDRTSVALLAPGTVSGDSSFGGLASFGGASVAENGYFINGFDVTNMRNFTDYASMPFDAVSQQQVKTGGYGAEFGRSLGGVISLTTKRGTNEWKGGASSYYSPPGSSALGKRVVDREKENWPQENVPSYTVYSSEANRSRGLSYNVYAGGPLVKDTLFFFGLLEGRNDRSDEFGATSSSTSTDKSPNGMFRFDWQINDDHRLEFTGINNRKKGSVRVYSHPNLSDRYATRHIGSASESSSSSGGDVEILKYTGYLMNDLTVTAQYGRLYHLLGRSNNVSTVGGNCPVVRDASGNEAFGCWNIDREYIRDPLAPENFDKRIGKRVDLEYTLGNHIIRAGVDAQTFVSSNAGEAYSGGVYYRYYKMPSNRTINSVSGAGTVGNSEYVRVKKFHTTSGVFSTTNDAFYLEDSWKVVPTVMLYGGIRSESFNNKNNDGISFVDKKNLLAPRLGASWDVNGDSSLKIYGNAGRYYIPVATNTNIRSSTSEYTESRYYNFSGKDPITLAPLNMGPQIGEPIIVGTKTAPNPGTVADTKLKPMSQDEFILGFQKASSNDLVFGVKTVYRRVNNGMDDFCGNGAISNWIVAQGNENFDSSTLAQCILMNPGNALNLNADLNNDGKLHRVTVPADKLGLARYIRTYKAIEMTVDKSFGDKGSLSASYVYAVNKGTAEGYVQSDKGQNDAGITADFDFASFTDGAYGVLPNSRKHSIKLYGSYLVAENLHVGANLAITSGRRTSCLGFVPRSVPDYVGADGSTAGGSGGYESAGSYYCLNAEGKSVLGHRGNGPLMPWTKSLDLNITYDLKLSSGHVLTLQANVFNVFNTQTMTMVNQVRDYSRADTKKVTGNRLNMNYGSPVEFQSPRAVSFGARLEF